MKTKEKKSSSSIKITQILKQSVAVMSIFIIFCLVATPYASATGLSIDIDTTAGDGISGELQLLFLFALISLGPTLLLMTTCFTRIIIVFSFLRNATGLQQTPPNQIIVGISLFLTLFIMQPTLLEINSTAIQPLTEGTITQEEALERVQIPLKKFMIKKIQTEDVNMFLSISGQELSSVDAEGLMNLGFEVIVPSFITSELKAAFSVGFLLFLPFLVIDMVVSSTLMSMGMVMLPPTTVSMPFKVMLFIIVDGWSLIIEMLVSSYYG